MPGGYRASFNDGRTAARWPAVARLTAGGLRIERESGDAIVEWRYEDVRLVDEIRPGLPLRLSSMRDPAARLTIEGAGVAAELWRCGARLEGPEGVPAANIRLIMVALTLLALATATAWAMLPSAAAAIASLMPIAWEEELGRVVREDLLYAVVAPDDPEAWRCEGQAGRATLDRLTATLAAASGTRYAVRADIYDAEMNNAFALPGGDVVVLSGLLDFTESPDELAGVLAHEIAHVIHRHSTTALVHQAGLSTFFDSITSGLFGAELAGSFGVWLLELSYSREIEAEADATAIELLLQAGLRTDGPRRFFARLESLETDHSAMLSTHPPGASRIAVLSQAEVPGGRPALTDEEWRALKSICDSSAPASRLPNAE